MPSYRETPMTPVILSSPFVTLSTNTATAIPDMAQLGNLARRAMLVDEIRWSYYFPSPPSSFLIAWGSFLRCQLMLGRVALTATRSGNGYVPLWAFGPALQLDQYTDCNLDTEFPTTPSLNGHFRWKLPKPLYVSAEQRIIPSLTRTDTLASLQSLPIQVGVSIVGRLYADPNCPNPPTQQVPFVAYYEPDVRATSAISSEMDLSNIFNKPLLVQRIVARLPTFVTGGGVAGTSTENSEAQSTPLITVKDSHGNNVVRDPSPAGQVFDYNYRSWTFNRRLGPKERYVISMTNINVVANSYDQPNIAMVGLREEEVQ